MSNQQPLQGQNAACDLAFAVDDPQLRVNQLLTVLETGKLTGITSLATLVSKPLPLKSLSTDRLLHLIRAMANAGFIDDAGRMLDYVLARRCPVAAQDRLPTALLALQLKRSRQAATLLAPVNGLADRYLYSIACHMALDWSNFDRTRLTIVELHTLLAQKPPWVPIMLFQFLMLPGYTNADHLALASRVSAVFQKTNRAVAFDRPMARPMRLRVGYLSGDFKNHPTSQMLSPVLEHNNRTRFEWICLDNSQDDASPQRARILSTFDQVLPVQQLSAPGVTRLIQAANIAVLVDLSGHTVDNRLDVMALHPAPVQISWLGYPGGLGGELVDYLITDIVCAPTGADADFAEALIRLPVSDRPGGECPVEIKAPSRASQGLPVSALVLACFNQQNKITKSSFELWCEVLCAVPGSVLWLMDEGESGRLALQAAAEQRGIQPDRLIWAARVAHSEHLQRMACADLMLDTHPYTMHTTAVDVLAAGVPYLTFCGETLASRVSASLLHTAGLADCVCSSVDAYRQRLLLIATDAAQRTVLRQRFAEARTESPLFDSGRFASYLEHAYDRAYGRWLGGLSPAPFTIEAQSISSETRAAPLGV